MKLFPRFLLEGEGGNGGSNGGGAGSFTPSFDGALKPDGSFADGWHQKAFGADYNGPLATAKTFGDVNKMLTDSMAAARAKTEGMIRVPGADAKAEDIAAYHKAMGVPDKFEDYVYTLPEGIKPENIDAKQMDAWRKEFKDAGVPKATAERLMNKHLADTAAQFKARAEEFAAGVAAERVEMAKRFPKIDETVSLAKSLANRAGVPESLKKAIEGGAFDPTNEKAFWGADALESFAWAARASGEDVTKGGGGGNGGMTIAEAKAIMGDSKHPLHEKYKTGDKEVTSKINAAYAAGF